jgi:Fic/DOC family
MGETTTRPDPRLREFVCESNRIENIVREPSRGEIEAHAWLLSLDVLHVPDIVEFVLEVAGGNAPLRSQPGMNVRVGGHLPPPGGPEIPKALDELLGLISDSRQLTPFEAHCRYETLHPFLDGNGRSGRAIWAWQMQDLGRDPFALTFLRSFYYQALDGYRA